MLPKYLFIYLFFCSKYLYAELDDIRKVSNYNLFYKSFLVLEGGEKKTDKAFWIQKYENLGSKEKKHETENEQSKFRKPFQNALYSARGLYINFYDFTYFEISNMYLWTLDLYKLIAILYQMHYIGLARVHGPCRTKDSKDGNGEGQKAEEFLFCHSPADALSQSLSLPSFTYTISLSPSF